MGCTVAWLLPAFFVPTISFLIYFGTLG